MLFRHRFVIFALGAPIPLIAILSNRTDGLPDWLDAAGYAAGCVALLATLHAMAVMCRRLLRWPVVLNLPFIVLNVPAVATALVVAETLNTLSGAAPRAPVDLAAAGMLFVVFIEAAMSLAVRSVLAEELVRRRDHGGNADLGGLVPPDDLPATIPLSALPASIRIGGRDIPLSDLSHIIGEGNLVTVWFGSRSLRLSARFATILVSLPDGAGMQINRMLWVSAPHAARSRLVRTGRESVLHLPDGTALPVAANRRAELAAWVRALQEDP